MTTPQSLTAQDSQAASAAQRQHQIGQLDLLPERPTADPSLAPYDFLHPSSRRLRAAEIGDTKSEAHRRFAGGIVASRLLQSACRYK